MYTSYFGLSPQTLKRRYAIVSSLFVLFLFTSTTTVKAQAKDAILNGTMLRCHTEQVLQNRLSGEPALKQHFDELQGKHLGRTNRIACDEANTIRIPLAFHFDSSFACTDDACILSEIQDAIATLNRDFASNTVSTNAANCLAAYPDISTGTCITFYLAAPPVCSGLDVTCDGSITVSQFVGGYSLTQVGLPGSGAGVCWDEYLNVFIVSSSLGVLGIADQIPGVLPAAGPGEGVTVAASAFGGADGPCGALDSDLTFNLGKTLSHEVGHYLGLFHVFQGACADEPNNSYLGTNITVSDTPAQLADFYGCPDTCVDSGCIGPQQTANIMNYTDDACMDLFTEDQAFAMNTVANGLFGSLNIPEANPSQLCTCVPAEILDLSISDGNATWAYLVEITGVGCFGNVGFDAGNGINQSFAADWYYSINGGTSVGFPFIDTSNIVKTNNTIEVLYPNLGGLAGLNARLKTVITENAELDVEVAHVMNIDNQTGAPVDISLFSYLDLDKNASLNQNASLFLVDDCTTITEVVAVNDPSQRCYFAINAADGFQVAPYPIICENLSVGINGLNNTGLPLVNTDYTQAYQYNSLVPTGESVSCETLLTFGSPPQAAVTDPVTGQCTFNSLVINPPIDFILCPADQLVSCGSEAIAGMITTDTLCSDPTITIDVSGPVINGDPDCPGTSYTYTYIASDPCNNIDTCSQTFTIGLGEAPVITVCPADADVICPNSIVIGIPSYTTNCGVGDLIINQGPVRNGPPNCPGTTYSYTIRVIDACGRESSCEQVFTIIGALPTIDCQDAITVTCEDDIRPITPSFTSGCATAATISKTGPVILGDPHCDGTTYTYTYTVTDACGQTASCEQVFMIDNSCQKLDFDIYPAGTIITNQYPGVSISTHDKHNRLAILFDTANPTSNDFDLGTPNEQFGGPGSGTGYGNDTFQGNALIISKDRHVPNETEGVLIFVFDCSVLIRSIDFLDMECAHNRVKLYDIDHQLIDVIPVIQYGENSFHVQEINQGGVYKMHLEFPCAGGGITAIKYCEDMSAGSMCGICDEANLDFKEPTTDWTDNALSGLYELSNQTIAIDIQDADGIFVDSEEDKSGLQIGIDPNDQDDIVTITYDLTEVANFVQFDIEDLDYKDGESKQQESVCICGFLAGSSAPIYPVITSLDGHVLIDGNCAEATTDSYESQANESVLVTFKECIDQVVIKYGNGTNTPTADPTYSKMIIGKRYGFNTKSCPNGCSDCALFGDSDGDGVCDDCDICFNGDDTIDLDENGIPDACDANCASLGDADNDGVCDDVDVCPGGNDTIDLDGNGVPDECEACNEYKLVFGCTYVWDDTDVSNQYVVQEQTFGVNIMDMDGILEDSQQDGFGLEVGINPSDTSEVVLIKYSLSEVANHVMFDIVDLDYKDGHSKQQEAVCIYGFLNTNPDKILPVISSLDGSVSISGNCAEATQNSSASGADESIMVVFNECIDHIVIEYGTGSNSPTQNPNYSSITIGFDLGFKTKVCVDKCVPASETECVEMLQLDGTAAVNRYQASKRIESTQMVKGTNVKYDAGKNILLKEGFQVVKGTVFSIQMIGCDQN